MRRLLTPFTLATWDSLARDFETWNFETSNFSFSIHELKHSAYRIRGCHNPPIPCCGFATERRPSPASACCSPSSIPGRSSTAPGTLSRNDNADAELNEWILAWVAHQLPRAPARLFQGNFFYPERDTLAYSEPLIVPALMGAPLHWLGASPVFVFNIVLILGFALTAWAGYALAFEWTGDRAAGMLAGSMFAFNTHTLTRLAHVQGIHAWGLPLTLLAADRILVHARWRDAVWLAVWMTAMAYTSGYLVVFGAIMIAVVLVDAGAGLVAASGPCRDALCRRHAARRPGHPARVSALPPPRARDGDAARDRNGHRVLGDVDGISRRRRTHPFLHVEREVLVTTPSTDSSRDSWSSSWLSRRSTGAWLAFAPPSAGESVTVDRLPGSPAAGSSCSWRSPPRASFCRSARTRPCTAGCTTVFPPMQGLRAAARFGNLFLLAMAALAAFGLAGSAPPAARAAGRPRRRRARGPRQHRVAARAVLLHALRRHPGRLLAARARAGPGRAGGSPVLSDAGRRSRAPSTSSIPPRIGGR